MPSEPADTSVRPAEAEPADTSSRPAPVPVRALRPTLVAGLLSLVIVGGLLLLWLVQPRDFFTGTNSVVGQNPAVVVPDGGRLCTPATIPPGTGRVRVDVQPEAGPVTVEATVRRGGRTIRLDRAGVPIGRSYRQLTVPTADQGGVTGSGTLCLEVSGGPLIIFGNQGSDGAVDPSPTLDGKSVATRVALWFEPPAGEQRSVLGQLPDIAARAALFRAAPVGAWTYWVLMLVALPALVIAALWLMWRAARGRMPRRAGAVVVLIAALNAVGWALITPSFQGPDEIDHYGYAEYLAQTGHRPSAIPPQPYSTDEIQAVAAVRLLSNNGSPAGRPPWTPEAVTRWEALERIAAKGADGEPRRDDGGGLQSAATHAPVYYAAAAAAYAIGSGDSVWGRLFAVRVITALLGSLIAFAGFALVRELRPGDDLLAVCGGLLAGLQPMVAFMSGTANNDPLLNALGGLLIVVAVRALRRGLTWRLAAALGVLMVLTPLAKFTGYFLYPAVLLALLGCLWRFRSRDTLMRLLALVAAFVVIRLGWALLAPVFDTPVPPAPDGAVGAGGAAASGLQGGVSIGSGQLSAARADPQGFLSYLWQIFLPPLPFMTDLYAISWPGFQIFVVRAWGAFGWVAIEFPMWVYRVIFASALGLSAAGLWGAWTRRRRIGAWLPQAAVLLAAVAVVVVGVELAFFSLIPRTFVAEQGRYLLSASVPLAGLATLGFVGAGRWRAPLAVATTVAVVMLGLASQWLVLSTFYT